MSSDVAQLLRRPGYARYFSVVAISRASGSMFTVSGVLIVLERTGDLALAGLVVAAGTLPGAFTGPVLGAWLDVAPSRRRLLILDRTLTLAALAGLLAAAGHAPNWTLPLIAALYGLTSPLSAGSFSSVLPEIAGAKLTGVAYTFEATSINIAFIVGPALAGAIAAGSGAAAAIEAQIAIGVVVAVLIATDATFELRPHDSTPPSRVRVAVREGLSSLWRIRPLRRNVMTATIYVTAWGTLAVGFPAYAVSVGAGASAAGFLWAAISAGSMASAFAFRRRAENMSSRRVIGMSFLLMAVSVLAWPLAPDIAAALALVSLTGVLEGPSLVALLAVRQRLTPPHLRGQIFSTVTSLTLAASAVGAALAGLLQRAAGTTADLFAFGILLAAAALVAFTGPATNWRDATEA